MARVTENTTPEVGIIREEDFSVIMTQAFATYGLSVVTDRALPDARDGLKPVQRRILAGMRDARFLSCRSPRAALYSALSLNRGPGQYGQRGWRCARCLSLH